MSWKRLLDAGCGGDWAIVIEAEVCLHLTTGTQRALRY